MIICEVCNQEIGHGQAVAHKVLGWVQVKDGKRVGSIMKPSGVLGYAHKVCLDTTEYERSEASNTLF